MRVFLSKYFSFADIPFGETMGLKTSLAQALPLERRRESYESTCGMPLARRPFRTPPLMLTQSHSRSLTVQSISTTTPSQNSQRRRILWIAYSMVSEDYICLLFISCPAFLAQLRRRIVRNSEWLGDRGHQPTSDRPGPPGSCQPQMSVGGSAGLAGHGDLKATVHPRVLRHGRMEITLTSRISRGKKNVNPKRKRNGEKGSNRMWSP